MPRQRFKFSSNSKTVPIDLLRSLPEDCRIKSLDTPLVRFWNEHPNLHKCSEAMLYGLHESEADHILKSDRYRKKFESTNTL